MVSSATNTHHNAATDHNPASDQAQANTALTTVITAVSIKEKIKIEVRQRLDVVGGWS
jgi:hypothetical protein